MIRGIQSFKVLIVYLLVLGCQNEKKCNHIEREVRVNQYNKTVINQTSIIENVSFQDTIYVPPIKMPIIFISKSQFYKALKKKCNYRLFIGSWRQFSRYNEFKNKNIYRVSRDSLYFEKIDKYLVDGEGLFCESECHFKYFLQDKIGDLYLVKLFVVEGRRSAIYTDSLTIHSPLFLPFHTITYSKRNLLFSTEYFEQYPKINEITFYRVNNNKIEPILRKVLHNSKISSPFPFRDHLFFIYNKNKVHYYAKMKIPTDKMFKLIKRVPESIILDSTDYIPPPK